MGDIDAVGSSSQGDGSELGFGSHGGDINTASRNCTDFVDDLTSLSDDSTDRAIKFNR